MPINLYSGVTVNGVLRSSGGDLFRHAFMIGSGQKIDWSRAAIVNSLALAALSYAFYYALSGVLCVHATLCGVGKLVMHYKLGQQSKTEALNDFMAAFENAATTFPVVRRVAAVMTGFAPHLRQELTEKATKWWNRPRPPIQPTVGPQRGGGASAPAASSTPAQTGDPQGVPPGEEWEDLGNGKK